MIDLTAYNLAKSIFPSKYYVLCSLIFYFFSAYHTYTYNSTAHTTRESDKILTVKYEDGAWTKPYYDCGGGNIWMMTYTVPFFGFENGQYFFK